MDEKKQPIQGMTPEELAQFRKEMNEYLDQKEAGTLPKRDRGFSTPLIPRSMLEGPQPELTPEEEQEFYIMAQRLDEYQKILRERHRKAKEK